MINYLTWLITIVTRSVSKNTKRYNKNCITFKTMKNEGQTLSTPITECVIERLCV